MKEKADFSPLGVAACCARGELARVKRSFPKSLSDRVASGGSVAINGAGVGCIGGEKLKRFYTGGVSIEASHASTHLCHQRWRRRSDRRWLDWRLHWRGLHREAAHAKSENVDFGRCAWRARR